jgi:hypothetical protein
MPRHFIISLLLFALIAGSASAADHSAGENGVVHAGGLTCFSIEPPAATIDETKHSPALYRSCDQLCGDRHAACTAATSSMNPMRSCASTYYDPSNTLCRCCAVEH